MLSENEGEGELGGSVIELIKLGPLSILFRSRWWTYKKKVTKQEKKCVCM